MAISDYKITAQDLDGKGNVGMPDTPNLTTQQMQEKLDELSLEVIVPAFNELVDYLNDNVDADHTIKAEDITNLRLDADGKIQVSLDHGTTWITGGASGHLIMDGSGTTYPARSRLQFSQNVVITDNEAANKTFISVYGEKGDKGDGATIRIGDVYDSDEAEVTNSGSETDAIFNFGLPRGESGSAASIRVGTVTSGTNASVYNTGTSEDAVFNFVLPKGDQGDPGTGLTLLDTYATYEELIAAHPTGQRGQAYFVGDSTEGVVYLWSATESAWVNVGELKGQKGDKGDSATITIGTVTEGNTTAVENVGTSTDAVFNFTLKKGDKGDQGNAGTIAIGTVTSGTTPSVTNVGTPTQAILNFVIPKGDKGDKGSPSVVNGKSGDSITIAADDIEMTGYVKPQSSSAIEPTDSIRSAIGKLEAKEVITEVDYSEVTNTPNLWNGISAYNSTTSYAVGNQVTYNNALYTCILANTGELPTNTTYWKLDNLANLGGLSFGRDGDGNYGYYGADGSLVPFKRIDYIEITEILESVRGSTGKLTKPFCPIYIKDKKVTVTSSATQTSSTTSAHLVKYIGNNTTSTEHTFDLGRIQSETLYELDIAPYITSDFEIYAIRMTNTNSTSYIAYTVNIK